MKIIPIPWRVHNNSLFPMVSEVSPGHHKYYFHSWTQFKFSSLTPLDKAQKYTPSLPLPKYLLKVILMDVHVCLLDGSLIEYKCHEVYSSNIMYVSFSV